MFLTTWCDQCRRFMMCTQICQRIVDNWRFSVILVSPSSCSDALNEGKEWHFRVVLMPSIGGKVPLESGLDAIWAGTNCRPRHRLRTPKRLFAPTQTIVRLGANGNGLSGWGAGWVQAFLKVTPPRNSDKQRAERYLGCRVQVV